MLDQDQQLRHNFLGRGLRHPETERCHAHIVPEKRRRINQSRHGDECSSHYRHGLSYPTFSVIWLTQPWNQSIFLFALLLYCSQQIRPYHLFGIRFQLKTTIFRSSVVNKPIFHSPRQSLLYFLLTLLSVVADRIISQTLCNQAYLYKI